MEDSGIFAILENLAMDAADDPEGFYESVIGLMQYEAVQKNIEFDGYFRTKWEIAAELPMTFNEEYFENEERSELYVYLSALVDQEIFAYLEYAWNLVNDENLNENILHREIYLLKENGVTF
ncbi:hypothetical protein U9K52_09830 [Chryseobacterium sp. MHB01]|uniref:hypothetical protein n=1 Tax=Chryseobacterium sp. MHB01 TaxID=3109433 RepID=UPI002AFF76B3|nr:hypothetical protein [Chryseobacterium sp. MHB01]MEA1849211.1 hypothetical protein [Chryseobacterium sp. MHB01]